MRLRIKSGYTLNNTGKFITVDDLTTKILIDQETKKKLIIAYNLWLNFYSRCQKEPWRWDNYHPMFIEIIRECLKRLLRLATKNDWEEKTILQKLLEQYNELIIASREIREALYYFKNI
jgi:hypothetical protein